GACWARSSRCGTLKRGRPRAVPTVRGTVGRTVMPTAQPTPRPTVEPTPERRGEPPKWRGRDEMNIGFIGLGTMGEPMAARLLAAGHSLKVHNRTRAREERLASLGAERAATPRECAIG